MDSKPKIRIASLIKKQHPQLSNTQIAKILQKGLVLSKGRPVKLKAWVSNDFEYTIPDDVLSQNLQAISDLGCELVQDTPSTLVICKPHKMHTVALDVFENNSVANWLMAYDENLAQVSGPLEMGLLNRLDFETQGLVVVAKNKDAYNILKDDWKLGRVQKFYTALTSVPVNEGEYEHFMGQRSKTSPKVFVLDEDPEHQWHPVALIVHSCKAKGDVYEVSLQLLTGHRHQIRAQLAHIGAPLLGDTLYGGQPAPNLSLQASRVQFTDPKTQKQIDVSL